MYASTRARFCGQSILGRLVLVSQPDTLALLARGVTSTFEIAPTGSIGTRRNASSHTARFAREAILLLEVTSSATARRCGAFRVIGQTSHALTLWIARTQTTLRVGEASLPLQFAGDYQLVPFVVRIWTVRRRAAVVATVATTNARIFGTSGASTTLEMQNSYSQEPNSAGPTTASRPQSASSLSPVRHLDDQW